MLDLCPDRFWLITPRLLLTEMSAAARRRTRQEETILTAGWLAAVVQRAKMIPDLDVAIGRRPRAPRDVDFYIDEMKVVLPGTTMDEWAARVREARQQQDALRRVSANAI